MKTLKELLVGVSLQRVVGSLEVEVNALHFDSRKVQPGDLFIAQRGVSVDGHEYIPRAVAAGAKVVVCETLSGEVGEDVTYVVVGDSSEALGLSLIHI